MSIFAPVAEAQAEKDTLGGFVALPSSVYNMIIKMWYETRTRKGGLAFNLEFETVDGKKLKTVIYPTSKKSGKEKTTYTDKEGKEVYLADFLTANSLAVMATGKQLHELTPKAKMVKLRDPVSKQEVPTSVPVYTEALGKPVKLGVLRVLENKTVKSGDEYVPTNDMKQSNRIDKVFNAKTNQTIVELNANVPAEFQAVWLEKNDGKDVDNFKPVEAQNTLGAASTAPVATTSLFDEE